LYQPIELPLMNQQNLSLYATSVIFEKCQLNCPFCAANPNPPDNEIQIPNALQSSIIPKFPIINLIGGDPLLSPHLPQILDTLLKRKRIVNIFTPLLMLPDNISSLLNTNVFAYFLSFDENEHDEMVGKKDAYKKLLTNIDQLKSCGIQPIVYYFTTKFNVSYLPEVSAYCKKNKLFLWLEIVNNFCIEHRFIAEEKKAINYFTKNLHTGSNSSSFLKDRMTCSFAPNLLSKKNQFRFLLFLGQILLDYRKVNYFKKYKPASSGL